MEQALIVIMRSIYSRSINTNDVHPSLTSVKLLDICITCTSHIEFNGRDTLCRYENIIYLFSNMFT